VTRRAWITIDDSPSSHTPRLIEALRQRGCDAVFFCVGEALRAHPDEADQLVRAGFLLGNHSLKHPAFSSLSLPRALEEIDTTDALIDDVYARCQRPRSRRLFRFPYGDRGGDLQERLQEELRQRGFESWPDQNGTFDVFWTFSTEDYRLWVDPVWTPEAFQRHLRGLAEGTQDEVVLFHDHPQSETRFPGYAETILETLQELRFVTS